MSIVGSPASDCDSTSFQRDSAEREGNGHRRPGRRTRLRHGQRCRLVGAFLAGPLMGYVKEVYGWAALFYFVGGVLTAIWWVKVNCTQ